LSYAWRLPWQRPDVSLREANPFADLFLWTAISFADVHLCEANPFAD
jgi:hypothetical protein